MNVDPLRELRVKLAETGEMPRKMDMNGRHYTRLGMHSQATADNSLWQSHGASCSDPLNHNRFCPTLPVIAHRFRNWAAWKLSHGANLPYLQ
jgi:hypothetical protein